MDRFFKYGISGVEFYLEKVELEMRERFYKEEEDEDKLDAWAEKSMDYISAIYMYMSMHFADRELTVLNVLKQLFRLALTGEYSQYQELDQLVYEDEALKEINYLSFKNHVMYCARWLQYYYYVYELDKHSGKDWKAIVALMKDFDMLAAMRKPIVKKPKEKKEELPQEEFVPALRDHLDRYMIGQDTLKKKICMLLYLWIYYGERTNFMIVGPTGSGKNHIINTIASFPNLGRTIISYDCSQLTPNGFTGSSVNEIMKRLKAACEKAKRPVAGSIVYLDEVDKIINFNHDSRGENVNAMVQQQMLSLLAGTEPDAEEVLFICGGAFPRIEDLKKETKKGIGFGGQEEEVINFDSSLRDQICQIGCEAEFMGRIGEIIQLEKLNRQELKQILTDKEIGVIPQKVKSYAATGVHLCVEEDVIEHILDRIVKEDLGARSVKNVMNELADSKYLYDVLMKKSNKLVIHKGMLYGDEPIFLTEEVAEDEDFCTGYERL